MGGFLATQDVEPQSLVDERLYADEIERLRLLLEASSTLLGSLSVEAMLPEILELAGRTLAADAYALWRRDDARSSPASATSFRSSASRCCASYSAAAPIAAAARFARSEAALFSASLKRRASR